MELSYIKNKTFFKACKYRSIVQTNRGIIIHYESFKNKSLIFELKCNERGTINLDLLTLHITFCEFKTFHLSSIISIF